MFENLSKREKILAIIVGSLLPFALITFGIVSIGGKLTDKTKLRDGLVTQHAALQKQVLLGKLASVRKAKYRSESLPSDVRESVDQYQLWLRDLAKDTVGMDNAIVKSNGKSPGGPNPLDPVIQKYKFTLTCSGTIRQLTCLLHSFNQAKLLHRINKLTVTPAKAGSAGRRKLTGKLNLIVVVEVVCMPEADSVREFENEKRETATRSLDDYHYVVSRRNLFGPPVGKLSFANITKTTFEPGKPISISLGVENDSSDAPEFQDLPSYEFELVESASGEAKIVQAVPGSDAAELVIPALEEGQHEFLMRATADDWNNQFDEKSLRLTIAPPKEDEPEPVAEIRPEARDTLIAGDTTRSNGERIVWINIRPQERWLKLAEGESFELDQKKWTIDKITNGYVTIICDGKRLTFKQTSNLASPEPDTAVSVSSGS